MTEIIRLHGFDAERRREEVLSRRRRIRRTSDMPESLLLEIGQGRTYRYKLTTAFDGYTAEYRRGRWLAIPDPSSTAVRKRKVVVWLNHQGRRVGGFELVEYAFDQETDQNLVIDMDDESHQDSRVGCVLATWWPNFGVVLGDHGYVVELATVWLEHRHDRPRVWIPFLRETIERLRRSSPLFLAHVFPLEYQWKCAEGTQANLGFERRRAAMKRAAERLFGFKPLPTHMDLEGWMWWTPEEMRKLVPGPLANAR